jgi:xanthine dehydrogenase large subunit
LVVARSHKQALVGAKKITAEINPLSAVLDAREAYEKKHWVLPPVEVSRGHALESIAKAPRHLSGSLDVGGQEHFYLEGQIAYALPQENGQWLIHSSTQHPGEVQHWVAHALNVPLHAVRVVCRRMGVVLAARKRRRVIWLFGRHWQLTSFSAPSKCVWTVMMTS